MVVKDESILKELSCRTLGRHLSITNLLYGGVYDYVCVFRESSKLYLKRRVLSTSGE